MCVELSIIIIIIVLPAVAFQSTYVIPMSGTADGDAISRYHFLSRAGSSIYHGASMITHRAVR